MSASYGRPVRPGSSLRRVVPAADVRSVRMTEAAPSGRRPAQSRTSTPAGVDRVGPAARSDAAALKRSSARGPQAIRQRIRHARRRSTASAISSADDASTPVGRSPVAAPRRARRRLAWFSRSFGLSSDPGPRRPAPTPAAAGAVGPAPDRASPPLAASATTARRRRPRTRACRRPGRRPPDLAPGPNRPWSSARASGFSTSRWIDRLSGRAPNWGSCPSRAITARAAGVSSRVRSRSASRREDRPATGPRSPRDPRRSASGTR